MPRGPCRVELISSDVPAAESARLRGLRATGRPRRAGWVELVTHEAEPAPAFCPEVLGRAVNTASEEYLRWSPAGEGPGGPVVMDDAFAACRSANRLPYLAVADVDTAAATAQEAGGELLMPPTSVPAGQRIAVVRDPRDRGPRHHRTGDWG